MVPRSRVNRAGGLNREGERGRSWRGADRRTDAQPCCQAGEVDDNDDQSPLDHARTVGLPIDIGVIRPDALEAEVLHRIEVDEPYFHDLRERWSAALRAAHKGIPRPPYGSV